MTGTHDPRPTGPGGVPQLDAMLQESGLTDAGLASALGTVLAPLTAVEPAPLAPSDALALLLGGAPGAAGAPGAPDAAAGPARPAPGTPATRDADVLPLGVRSRRALAGALVLAVSGVGATGLSAAANTLPPALQRHVSDFSRHHLPFTFPQPPRPAQDQPLSALSDAFGALGPAGGANTTDGPSDRAPGLLLTPTDPTSAPGAGDGHPAAVASRAAVGGGASRPASGPSPHDGRAQGQQPATPAGPTTPGGQQGPTRGSQDDGGPRTGQGGPNGPSTSGSQGVQGGSKDAGKAGGGSGSKDGGKGDGKGDGRGGGTEDQGEDAAGASVPVVLSSPPVLDPVLTPATQAWHGGGSGPRSGDAATQDGPGAKGSTGGKGGKGGTGGTGGTGAKDVKAPKDVGILQGPTTGKGATAPATRGSGEDAATDLPVVD